MVSLLTTITLARLSSRPQGAHRRGNRSRRGADVQRRRPGRDNTVAASRPLAVSRPRRQRRWRRIPPLRGARRYRHRRPSAVPKWPTMLAKSHAVFPFEFVLMAGDNLYGSERPQDFTRKFELPYKALLDAKIPFYAALGNHDDPNQRFYKLFNMNGERFYTFKKQSVRFFALDSNYMDRDQIAWLKRELENSGSDWKIPFFHHPLYSSGGTHGSEVDLRQQIEPLFLQVRRERGLCRP